DRDAKRQVAHWRRRGEVADRKRAPAVRTSGAKLKRVRIEVERRQHIESDLRPLDLLLFAWCGRVEIPECLRCREIERAKHRVDARVVSVGSRVTAAAGGLGEGSGWEGDAERKSKCASRRVSAPPPARH